MNKIVLGLLSAFFPLLALAQDSASGGSSSISFAPPPSDYSVVFLGNIFGIVDGVLHGTGSQIMGTMFSVFNSAVLALGGIIIMYTLLVSTVNTAHEGQMLGQKWSSIWVPLRSTFGLALLIPKASGYCLMQIFVMWVVVQGVGAADKVWQAALSYLNRGGVIVQAQMDPMKSILGDNGSIATGATAILAGQVCMLGLQNTLTSVQQGYKNQASKNSGPCVNGPSKEMKDFCQTNVPDFLNTVNVVTQQNNNPNNSKQSVPMPNFDSDSAYSFLNGICGKIEWNAYPADKITTIQKNISTLDKNEIDTVKMSRAIAIQQMYQDLSQVATVMVNNDPKLNSSTYASINKDNEFSKVAVQQYGVAYMSTGVPCSSPDKDCISWGSDSSAQSAPLFNGTEFQGAVADYNGIMLPTLNLYTQATESKTKDNVRDFIAKAEAQGWLMAGSYFIDLAKINSSDIKLSNQTDSDSGLDSSSADISTMTNAFGGDGTCKGQYSELCQWYQGDDKYVKHIAGLIDGSTVLNSGLDVPTFNSISHKAVTGLGSSTTYGYISNASMVQLPGQPGIVTAPKFAMKINITFTPFYLKPMSFSCGKVQILFFVFCLGEMFGVLLYNVIFVTLFNLFLSMMAQIINMVVLTFLSVPLQGMAQIFTYGVSFIQQPTVNPVIALANMGVNYINFANELWIYLLMMAITSILIPWFGVFIFPLIAMVMPLLIAWLGTMVSIGFTTAYFIPFLPYMIFTFGTMGWLIAVIEAMVAAPIVALGITHPEGEGAFGKGEQAIMILMNVFLRPAMMIIGYIAAIALSYVVVWIINAGFYNVVTFIQGDPSGSAFSYSSTSGDPSKQAGAINTSTGYTGWAGIYGFFFSILVYTMMYVTAVTKSFTLITYLPDKVLRWIGGQPEGIGQETSQWAEEPKKQISDAGSSTAKAAQQIDKQLSGYAMKGVKKAASAVSSPGANVEATAGGE
ncbi:defect in organelle trafficking protein DotA [Legionella quinlivanii]|uniref:Defect in organelle trafficking protein DotA n=1 Tax=Legionella quinlivanii TaxID=45073 RepID=A0A0W0Y028_9GAMM|nr:type IVB secretion system protein DotA [Legionella quinlivanii]KTD50385.1 defect in organelle trafficking protein DotA [Legionella quinlivanii]SEF41661.1 defect in organelle trafficking protein DotA [Legionella quinlivanii DSM 21216]STY11985.1 defect in organelle trafficking protein DotA [Legionella quinlivanii]